MSGQLQCYNKGCGQKFKEEENGDGKFTNIPINAPFLYLSFIDVCCHHPGVPVFHDAMKVSI